MNKDEEEDPWSDETKRKKKEEAWGGAQDDNSPKDSWGEASSSAGEGFPVHDPWKSSSSPYEDDEFPSAEEERKSSSSSSSKLHDRKVAGRDLKDDVEEAKRQLEVLRKQDAELKRRSPLTYCTIQGLVGGAIPGICSHTRRLGGYNDVQRKGKKHKRSRTTTTQHAT